MSLSIVICTRGRPQLLRRCLARLRAADLQPVREVIVVDQSDQPLDPSALREIDPGLLRYAWRPGRGLARARNHALELSQGQFVAFTDDDCLPTPEWPAAIMRAFATHPAPDAVYGRVLAHAEPGVPVTYRRLTTPFGTIAYATRPPNEACTGLIERDEPAVYTRPVMPNEHIGAGNNMAFRRSVFERHGLFVEQLGAGTPMHAGEDIEMHLRLMRAGCVLRYEPDALVYHDAWRTEAQHLALDHGYTTGTIAVHVAYALKGEPLSLAYLRYRLGSVRREAEVTLNLSQQPLSAPRALAHKRKPIGFYIRRTSAVLSGVLGGLMLARQRESAPALGAQPG